jgi:hypothetical protein
VALAGVLGVPACLRRGGAGACHAMLLALVALAVFAAAALTPEQGALARGLLVVLGILPLVNALGDIAAIGKARWLLRRTGRRGWLVLPAGLADLAFGLVLAVGCAGLAVAALHGANLVHQATGDGPLLDLQALIDDLGAEAALWRHGWLIASFATVLLPSLLLGCLIVFSTLAAVGQRPIRSLAALFPGGGAAWEPRRLAVVFASMAGFALVSTALPLALMVWAVMLLHHTDPMLPARGLWLLGWFARSLGAPVDPGLWP